MTFSEVSFSTVTFSIGGDQPESEEVKSFSAGSFSSGFSNDPVTPPVTVEVETPRGNAGPLGIPASLRSRARTRLEVEEARRRYGIPAAAAAVIAEVAERQVARLEPDEHKRFEELSRELDLRYIEWRAEYLDQLNARREALIAAEIRARLAAMLEEEEETLMVALIAAALA